MLSWLNDSFLEAHAIDVQIRHVPPYPINQWGDRRYCATLNHQGRKVTIYPTCGALAPDPDPAIVLDHLAFVSNYWEEAQSDARLRAENLDWCADHGTGSDHYASWCGMWDKDPDSHATRRAYKRERRWIARLKDWCGSPELYQRLCGLATEDECYDADPGDLQAYYCAEIGA